MEPAGSVPEGRDYWDRVACEKRFTLPLRVDWLNRHVGPQAHVLDFGCGYGRALEELWRAGYENLTGVDVSSGMLRQCRSRFPVARLVQCDGRCVPARTGSADLVLLIAVLTCITNDEGQRELLKEVRRVLRPGGMLYIGDFLLNKDARNLERYEQLACNGLPYGVFRHPEGVLLRHHRPEWIEDLTSPFQRLESEPYAAVTMNGNSSAAFQYLGRSPRL
jgi:ubiquinone/menaquinone biosynthesis C-methylase UbiE